MDRIEASPLTLSKLKFGKHQGHDLGWLLWHDTGYFFWGFSEGVFREPLRSQAEYLYERVTRITLNPEDQGKVVEYISHPHSGGFTTINLIDPDDPNQCSANACLRTESIDMSAAWQIRARDKLGNQLLLRFLRQYKFGGKPVTPQRRLRFLADDRNFDLLA